MLPTLALVNLALASTTEFAYKSAAGAYASVDPESGWRTLSVTTSDSKGSSPREAAFDAGFVEGQLTCAEITQFFDNFYVSSFREDSPNDDIVDYVNEDDAFVESMFDTVARRRHIASINDYYTVDGASSLTVVETSNNVYDDLAYNALTPKSVFCWVRIMVANQMSVDGESWSKAFSAFHSGTYNNQWLIVDRERFESDEGLLWVVEEAPGLMHPEDMTEKLRSDGYWGSYNVAWAVMGETETCYEAPRANLFAEMQFSVKDMDSMTYVMGWNEYLNDPNSEGKASNVIMARDDLLNTPRAGGGIDSKDSTINTLKTVGTLARVGPTYGGEGVDAFCWSGVPTLEETTVLRVTLTTSILFTRLPELKCNALRLCYAIETFVFVI